MIGFLRGYRNLLWIGMFFFTVLAIALLAGAIFFFSSGNGRSGVRRSDFAGEVSGMAKG